MTRKQLAAARELGRGDGDEMARESGSADAGPDGWDGLLLNALGLRGTRKLFGLTGEQSWRDDPAFARLLEAYVEGAQEGADEAVANS